VSRLICDCGYLASAAHVARTVFSAAVRKVLQHHLDELLRKLELLAAETQLLELEHRIGEKHVVVEVGVEVRTALHVCGQQPPVAPEPRADEIERARSRGH
jgi:hypothetical protein